MGLWWVPQWVMRWVGSCVMGHAMGGGHVCSGSSHGRGHVFVGHHMGGVMYGVTHLIMLGRVPYVHNSLVAHDCGYPLSRYTCRATRVAADFLDFIAFCRCSTGVALHPLKILVSHLPPPCAGRCRTEIWVWKGVALHGGVAATVAGVALHCATKHNSLLDKILWLAGARQN